MVVREGMTVALVGAAVGIVGALLLTRSMSGFLYGVRPADPVTIAVVAGVFAFVTLGASWAPARRAIRLDPVQVLREG